MSLLDIFAETISPHPESRQRAEHFLATTISNNPPAALDILSFCCEWGAGTSNLDDPNSNSSIEQHQRIAFSRLAAAIFLKNMILRSPWGIGRLNQQQNENQGGGGGSDMFSNFAPPPPLQCEIRTRLVAALANFWPGGRPSCDSFPQNQQQIQNQNFNNNFQNQQQQLAAVDSTIRRYVQTAILSIHDVDWPDRWPDLFDQAAQLFSSNILPEVTKILQSFSQNNFAATENQNQNYFLHYQFNDQFRNSNNPPGILNLANVISALHRGTAALSIIKMCCSRLFDPEDQIRHQQMSAAGGVGGGAKKRRRQNENQYQQLEQHVLQTLGPAVLAPFIQIASSVDWSNLFIHAAFAQQHFDDVTAMQQQQQNPMNATNNNNNSSNLAMNKYLLSTFMQGWTEFLHEGLRALLHLSKTQIFGVLLDATVADPDAQMEYRNQAGGGAFAGGGGGGGGGGGQPQQQQQQIPIIFAILKSCTRIHHALLSRLLLRRENIFWMATAVNNNNNNQQQQQTTPNSSQVFLLDSRQEQNTIWRLWRRVWSVMNYIFEMFSDANGCPKNIRRTHRAWISEHFVPALQCAVSFFIVHDNKPCWRLNVFSQNFPRVENFFLNNNQQQGIIDNFYTQVLRGTTSPGEFSLNVIIVSYLRACAGFAAQQSVGGGGGGGGGNSPLLLAIPFCFAHDRVDSDALGFALDVIDNSVRNIPWAFWDNLVLASNFQRQNINNNNLNPNDAELLHNFIQNFLHGENFPPEIAPLFLGPAPSVSSPSSPNFNPELAANNNNNNNVLFTNMFCRSLGAFSWFFVNWLLIPRIGIDAEEVEQWEINPNEYLFAQTAEAVATATGSGGGGDQHNNLFFSAKATSSRILASLIAARATDKDSMKNQITQMMQQQINQQNLSPQQQKEAAQHFGDVIARDQIDQIRMRIHSFIDICYSLLQQAQNSNNNNQQQVQDPRFINCLQASYDATNPSACLLAADCALQVLRICRRAVLERDDAEAALLCGVLPLFKSRFGPLRAKAAQLASELCGKIQWGNFNNTNSLQNQNQNNLAEQNFQSVLTAALDLMYDNDVSVRMQVCMRLSPLIRHPLAGQLVVPHLVAIVKQFFFVMQQTHSDHVILTLRKLFAHYRGYIYEWTVDLTRVILGRFEEVVGILMRMDAEEVANAAMYSQNGSQMQNEFSSNVGAGGGRGGNEMSEEALRREIFEQTTVGDELLNAISTLIKCMPRPASLFASSPSQEENVQYQQNQQLEQQLEQHTTTSITLQETLCPMMLAMLESPNSMGFFDGGLKLISNLLIHSSRVHRNAWEIFTALFRVVCVRGVVDYFTNMISALDNFASADPVTLICGRSQRPPPPPHLYQLFLQTNPHFHNQQNEQQQQQQQPQLHPAENATFMTQALAMLELICSESCSHLPLCDIANAIQCVDCFVLNGAKLVSGSVCHDLLFSQNQNQNQNQQQQHVTRRLLQVQLAGDGSSNNHNNNVNIPTFEEMCTAAQNADPLRLADFIDLPRRVVVSRARRCPPQCQQMNLPITPSMCVLLSNSVFCCVLAAQPAVVATANVLQARALMSFVMVSRLFETFGGVGSGNFHRPAQLQQVPLSFRVYDRKLFILALSHFLTHNFYFCQQQQQGQQGQQEQASELPIFATLRNEGHLASPSSSSSAPPTQVATEFFSRLIWTAILMSIENSYYDCRMLSSLVVVPDAQSSQEQNLQNQQNQNDHDEFYVDEDEYGRRQDQNGFFNDDSLTDCSTDEDNEDQNDLDPLGIFGGGGGGGLSDGGDEDDDDLMNDSDFEFDDENDDEEDNFAGGGGRNDMLSRTRQLAQAAARADPSRQNNNNNYNNNNENEVEGDDEDDEYNTMEIPDDFEENLLLENASDEIETPIDDVNEYRYLGAALNLFMSSASPADQQQNQQQPNFIVMIRDAITLLVNQNGPLPIGRMRYENNQQTRRSSSRRQQRKRRNNNQQAPQQDQQQPGEAVFAFHAMRNPHSDFTSNALTLENYLQQCVRQREAIEQAVLE